MKKITLLFTMLFLFTFSWQGIAQFGCGEGVEITDGYTASGITTPGTDGAEDWNDPNPTNMSDGVSANYFMNDVYMFTYTAGATAEEISMTTFTRNNWNGLAIFETCTGTALDDSMNAMSSSSSSDVELTVTAAISAGQTVYIATGQWGTPNGLDFDVVSFSVTAVSCPAPLNLSATDFTTDSAVLGWQVVGEETMWNIEYGETGFALGDGTTVTGVDTNPYTLEGLTELTSYDFYVQADCSGDGTEVSEFTGPFTFIVALAAVNDTCVGALPIACDETLSGDTSDPSVSDTGSQAARDLWYSFTGTGEVQTITASLCGSAYDTKITIFDTCDGEVVAFNDDFCSTQSQVDFMSDGVSTYIIAVEGFSASSMGVFDLTITCADYIEPPVNNECDGAIALTLDTILEGEDNTDATANLEPTSCDAYGVIADLWYSFVAPAGGSVSVSTTLGTALDAGVAVYSGACDDLTGIACDDVVGANSVSLTELVEGDTYYVQVWNNGDDEQGTFNIVVELNDTGIADQTIDGFSMFPNPVEDTLNINATNSIDAISVYNLLGQKVLVSTPSTTQVELDTANLPTGAYIVKVQVGEQVASYNLIKQ